MGDEVMAQDTEFLLSLLKKLTGHGLSVYIVHPVTCQGKNLRLFCLIPTFFFMILNQQTMRNINAAQALETELIIEIYISCRMPTLGYTCGFLSSHRQQLRMAALTGVNYSDADIEGIIKLLPSLNIEKFIFCHIS